MNHHIVELDQVDLHTDVLLVIRSAKPWMNQARATLRPPDRPLYHINCL